MFIVFGVISIDVGGVNCYIYFIGSWIFFVKGKSIVEIFKGVV